MPPTAAATHTNKLKLEFYLAQFPQVSCCTVRARVFGAAATCDVLYLRDIERPVFWPGRSGDNFIKGTALRIDHPMMKEKSLRKRLSLCTYRDDNDVAVTLYARPLATSSLCVVDQTRPRTLAPVRL